MEIKNLSGISFFLLFISIISLLSSCTSNDSHVVKNIKVDVDKCDLSALEDNVSIRKIVQLDNTYPLGNVSKALIVEDKIFIQDKQCEQIIGFNQQGKFLFKIADLGKGPKEYTHIQSFFVDRFNNKIKVLEGTGKILSYDFDGNFISVFNGKEKNCFKQIMNAIQLNKTTQIHIGLGPDFNLEYVDKSGNTRKTYLPFILNRDFSFSNKAFSRNKESILFCHGMDDSIYNINSKGVNARYFVDFMKTKIAQNLYVDNPGEIEKIYEKRKVSLKLDNLNETSDHILFSYWVFDTKNYAGKRTQFAIYNKTNGETFNIVEEFALLPVVDVIEESVCVSIVPPVSVCNSGIKNQKFAKFIKDNNIQEDQNPLLVFWEIL
jgi:hypothetical protein